MLRGHESRPHCHDTVLRYAATLHVCTHPKSRSSSSNSVAVTKQEKPVATLKHKGGINTCGNSACTPVPIASVHSPLLWFIMSSCEHGKEPSGCLLNTANVGVEQQFSFAKRKFFNRSGHSLFYVTNKLHCRISAARSNCIIIIVNPL